MQITNDDAYAYSQFIHSPCRVAWVFAMPCGAQAARDSGCLVHTGQELVGRPTLPSLGNAWASTDSTKAEFK